MFIEKKDLNGIEIYIKRSHDAVHAIFKKENKEISFRDYSSYYSLDLFEYDGELYLIRRCSENTFVIPIEVLENKVFGGKLMVDFLGQYLTKREVENFFRAGFFSN